MATQLEKLPAAIIDQLKAKLGDRFASLTPADRSLIAACATDAAQLAINAQLDPSDQTLAEELAQTNAQLLNIRSVGESEAATLASDFWAVVGDAAKVVVDVAVKAAIKAAVL